MYTGRTDSQLIGFQIIKFAFLLVSYIILLFSFLDFYEQWEQGLPMSEFLYLTSSYYRSLFIFSIPLWLDNIEKCISDYDDIFLWFAIVAGTYITVISILGMSVVKYSIINSNEFFYGSSFAFSLILLIYKLIELIRQIIKAINADIQRTRRYN